MTGGRSIIVVVFLLLLGGAGLMIGWHPSAPTTEPQPPTTTTRSPVPGMVTLVDLGAGTCIPCKLMAPILDEVRKEYDGRAAVIFIDVYRERDKLAFYGVRAIPTQIFFDAAGNEVFRHVGFMDKRTITAQLAALAVQ